jgi:hypothetical protein
VDNIQKSILAVLGIAAFATLIVPGSDDAVTESPKPVEPAKVDSPPPPVTPAPATEPDPDGEYASQEGDLAEPDEYASFGQPMMDASPMDQGPLGQGEYASSNQAQSRERPRGGVDVTPAKPGAISVGPPPT